MGLIFSLDLMKIIILIIIGIFSITPNYRVYFSNKYARGFFIEGFGMLHRYKDLYYDYDESTYNNIEKNITEFSLGVSVGGKWVTKKWFCC